MHVIIAGCGRVGSQLARELVSSGHEVAIVDKDQRAFRRLGDDFPGRALHGIVFDRATLEEAGIRRAQAFVAVTNGDNSNVVSARTARDHYGVEHVVARIYDPARAVIYERLGITTIASAQWTVEEITRELLAEGEGIAGGLGPGPGDVVLLTLPVPAGVRGVPADRVSVSGVSILAAITRQGHTAVPVNGGLLEEGDRLHLAAQRDRVDRVRALVAGLGAEPA